MYLINILKFLLLITILCQPCLLLLLLYIASPRTRKWTMSDGMYWTIIFTVTK